MFGESILEILNTLQDVPHSCRTSLVILRPSANDSASADVGLAGLEQYIPASAGQP